MRRTSAALRYRPVRMPGLRPDSGRRLGGHLLQSGVRWHNIRIRRWHKACSDQGGVQFLQLPRRTHARECV